MAELLDSVVSHIRDVKIILGVHRDTGWIYELARLIALSELGP